LDRPKINAHVYESDYTLIRKFDMIHTIHTHVLYDTWVYPWYNHMIHIFLPLIQHVH